MRSNRASVPAGIVGGTVIVVASAWTIVAAAQSAGPGAAVATFDSTAAGTVVVEPRASVPREFSAPSTAEADSEFSPIGPRVPRLRPHRNPPSPDEPAPPPGRSNRILEIASLVTMALALYVLWKAFRVM